MTDFIIYLILGLFIGIITTRIFTPKKKIKTEVKINPVLAAPKVFTASSIIPEPPPSLTEDKLWYEEEAVFFFRFNEKVYLVLEKEKICHCMLEEVHNFFNANDSALLLLNQNTGDLTVECALGSQADITKNLSLSRGQSISGLVIEKREPLLINDLQNYNYYYALNKEEYLKNSFISVPLIFKDETIGALNVANKKSNKPFTNRDLEFLLNVARIGAIALKNSALHIEVQEGYLKTITTLAMIIDARDHYTQRHSENVTRYAVAIAREMGLNPGQIGIIKNAGLLHDIGKIGIRDDVLLKPGKLTVEEFNQIKSHPVIGAEIVSSLPFLKDVSCLVRHHHERFDGNGYPDGKTGEGIELGSRILAVADTFDALTTDRPYRKRLSLEVSREELIRNKFTQFDPAVVEFFLRVLEKSPGIVQ